MKTKKLMFGAAVAATIALVFPAQALATATSTVTINDANANTVPANIYGGNKYDLTTGGTVEATGEANHAITSLWSGQSLELDDTSSVVMPDGWSVEYTANGGTSWSSTAPTRTTINGVRTSGSVNRVGADKYESTSHPVAVSSSSSFTSSGGGDGYNVIFAGNKVFNIYHHATSVTLQCHLKSNGDSCYTGTVPSFTGYKTNNASAGFYDGNASSVYAYAMRTSDRHVGFLKINVSNINAVSASTPVFIPLTTQPIPSAFDASYQKYMNTASRSGDYIWSIDGVSDQLLCMKISTNSACPEVVSSGVTRPVNGATVSTVGFSSNGYHGGSRVTAVGTKVIYTTQNKIGCFDASTGFGCNGSATNEVAFTSDANNFPAFPVWDNLTAGAPLLGYCHYDSKKCITLSGAALTMPAALSTWITIKGALPLWNTRENAGEWASQGKKVYFPGAPTVGADNTTDADCYDSVTGASCAGFTGTNVGVRIYSLVADPQNANCVWTNGDAGEIKSFNATSGALGCSSSAQLVEISYQALAPRFGCVESKRVYTWVSALFTGTNDVLVTNLQITMLDSNGSAISGWVNRSVAGSGLLDLSGLTTAETGMRPTMQITSTDSGDTATQLEAILGAITFTAEAPQLCFVLKAVTKCPGVTLAGTDHSVPAGVVEVTTTTTPVGAASISSNARSVTSGTTSSELCAASTPNYTAPTGRSSGGGGGGAVTVLPVPTTPKAKRPPVTITIGGFRDGSPVLTKAIQNKIKAFLKKYNDYPIIETAGFTEGPVVLKTDFALSKARAVNATKYIKTNLKKKFLVVKIKSGQDKVEASKVRRIKITLTDE